MDKSNFRAILLHEFKLGHKGSEATRSIHKASGKNVFNELTVQHWFKKFRSGDISLEDKDRSGRPSTVDDDRLRAIVEDNPRKTVREIAKELEIDIATVSRHLEAIGKVKKLDKWVPHELNNNLKNLRLEICSSLLTRNQNDPFLDRIMTLTRNGPCMITKDVQHSGFTEMKHQNIS